MKFKYIYFYLGVFILFFISCQPDLNPDDDSTDPPRDYPEITQFYIDIDGTIDEIGKEEYVQGNLRIEGTEEYGDFEGELGIRGRGNSSWEMPKKPYKLKLQAKAPLMGLPAYKKWILLNSYLDATLMLEAVAYHTGKLLGIPYTNTLFPVELTLNNEYQGFYFFTEHKEVGGGRIDIGEDGWLLELDTYFDEPLQFKSAKYGLPVMIKYPKYKNMTGTEAEETLAEIQEDFEALEALIYNASFPENGYLDYFDDVSFINYLIVYQLTLNWEINHPKSVYINKPAGEKYQMGIIWDFDWAFGYSGRNSDHLNSASINYPLLLEDDSMKGTQFFRTIMEDPHMQDLFKERWLWFKSHKFSELKRFVKTWAEKVEPAFEKDHELWGLRSSSGDALQDADRIIDWLEGRSTYIDNYVSRF